MKIKDLYKRYSDVIPYLFFGVCTTGVNVFSYWFVAHILALPVMTSTVIAWILAVSFAYVTNRKWVFHSTAVTKNEIIKECISFFLCRLATGVIDWLCMYIFVEILLLNDVIIKFLANVLVIVLNYVASKLIVFKRGLGGKNDKEN